jgi:hypothetical protein
MILGESVVCFFNAEMNGCENLGVEGLVFKVEDRD